MSAELELIPGIEIAKDNVPRVAAAASAGSSPVSVLVAVRTRILGEALADVLLRTGYAVHLAPPGCSPRAIVTEAHAIRPTLVLLDLPRSATPATAEAIAELNREHVRVIVLGPDASLRSCATRIPVDGWARPSDSLSSLVDTVRQSAPIGAAPYQGGQDQGPPSRTGIRALEGPNHVKSRFEFLTPREQQVLMALMDGTPAVKIARQSFMSPSTVRHHIRSILLKLNVNSQLAAVAAAYQAGWTPARSTTPRAVNAGLADGSPRKPSMSHVSRHGRAHAPLDAEQVQRLFG